MDFKIVTGKEMARVESLAYQDGYKEEEFMEKAGFQVFEAVKKFCIKKVWVLCGKGNNAGDGFVVAKYLLENNFSVVVLQLFDFDACSKLCALHGKDFVEKGGKIVHSLEDVLFEKESIIVDALLGTGFSGILKDPFFKVIEKANASNLPIVSIDCPSGLDTNTGIVQTISIKATQTVFLGLAKIGFFVNDGYNFVGKLSYGDFGLPQKYSDQAQVFANLIDERRLKEMLPQVPRKRHKYQAGYVLSVAGSKGMEGAAFLSSFAALRSGAGIVRLFYPEGIEEEAPLELICETRTLSRVLEEQKKAKAFLIGPGLGRSEETTCFLKELFPQIEIPCVIDADALFFLSTHLDKIPQKSILTPHVGEMMRLLNIQDKDPFSFHQKVQEFAEKYHVTILLKGAPNFIFHPQNPPLVIPKGDPGMATAGAGDVLTGVIAAFLAEGLEPERAAILGCYLHGLAGEIAADEKTSYSLIASDVIEHLPLAFKILSKNSDETI